MPVTHWVDRFFENVSADSCVSGTHFLQHGGDVESKGFLLTPGLAAEPQRISDLSTRPLREPGRVRVRLSLGTAHLLELDAYGPGPLGHSGCGASSLASTYECQEHPLHV